MTVEVFRCVLPFTERASDRRAENAGGPSLFRTLVMLVYIRDVNG